MRIRRLFGRARVKGDLGADGELKEVSSQGVSGNFWLTREWIGRTARTSGAVWIGAALAFGASVISARRLGLTDYGQVVLALALCAFIAAFLDISLEEGVVYLGTKALESNDRSQLWTLLRIAFTVDLLVGISVWAALVLASTWLSSIVNGSTSPTLIRIASLTVLLSTINGTTGAVLLLAHRSHVYASVQAITAGVLLSLVLVAPATPQAILWANVGSTGAGALLMLFLAYRSAVERYGRPSQRSESTGIRRELFRFGIHSSVTTSVGSATDSLLPVLVGSMQGASAAAIFAIAKLPLTVASLVTVPVRIVFLPEQARLSAQENPAAVRRSVAAYVKTASVIAAVGVVAGWVLLPTLINLFYGASFEGAVPPARILLVAAAIFVAFGWTKILPVAIGRPELRTRTLGAVSALILIGTFGLGGSAVAAATAVSIAYVIYALMWVWLFKRLLPKAEERL